jgi:hypothetical protein
MFEIVNNIVSEIENKKYEPDFAERTTTPHTHGVIEHTDADGGNTVNIVFEKTKNPFIM